MRKLLMLALAAALIPTASFAQFQIGARVGYAPAMGTAFEEKATEFDPAETSKMKDGLKSQVPLQLDAMYKVTKDVAAGVYFGYGFGQVGGLQKAECTADGVDCSGNVIRAGVQGIYAFNQLQSPVVPWAGLGLGYERAQLKGEKGPAEGSLTASGFELNLQAGGDYAVTEQFSVGPYVMLSVGQYTSVKAKQSGDPDPTENGSEKLEINNKLHQWFGFGIQGKFSL